MSSKLIFFLIFFLSINFSLEQEGDSQKIEITLELIKDKDKLGVYPFVSKDYFGIEKTLIIDGEKQPEFSLTHDFQSYGKHIITIEFSSILTNLNSLFYQCDHITEINFASINSETKVTDMTSAFYGCTNLKSIKNLNKISTSLVTSFSNMFGLCKSFEQLDLTSFDTSTISSMDSMFEEFAVKKILDISSFEISNADINYENMFKKAKINELHIQGKASDNFYNELKNSSSSFEKIFQCTYNKEKKTYECDNCEEKFNGCKVCGNSDDCLKCNIEKGYEEMYEKCFVKRNFTYLMVWLVITCAISFIVIFGVVFYIKYRESNKIKKEQDLLENGEGGEEGNEDNKLTRSSGIEARDMKTNVAEAEKENNDEKGKEKENDQNQEEGLNLKDKE